MKKNENAGFWIRLLATWLDCLFIYALLKLIFYFLLTFSIYYYFPFQFTFFLVFIFYQTIAVIFYGQTLGKFLLSLKVVNNNNKRLKVGRSMLRESIFKVISAPVFGLGFLWIAFSKSKKGWHDYLTGAKVIHTPHLKYNQAYKVLVTVSLVFALSTYILDFGQIVWRNKVMSSSNEPNLPFMRRLQSSTKEISTITDQSLYINWLNQHGLDPTVYATKIASNYEVTLFGEMHNNKSNLLFFNSIIETLYKKSGVRCIGMEAIPYTMNKKIEQLVNGKTYNEALAIEIARSQPWSAWGDKEYWDILKTVWEINVNLPKDDVKMRLVGIDYDWEGANIALLNIGGNKRGPTSFWEKFRIFPAISDLFKATNREGLMAYQIQKEMIQKKDKAVVMIGFAHTMLNFGEPNTDKNKIININKRMGILLNQKFPGKIFQIELFHQFDTDNQDNQCISKFAPFIESVMTKRDNLPVGFTIGNSPFGQLRDHCTPFFNTYPTVIYQDISNGLIFLKPLNKMPRCTWTRGYISNEMFMRYKPLYELVAKKAFANATEVDNYFAHSYLK